MNSEKLKNTLLAIIACLLWSSAFVGIKIGLPCIMKFFVRRVNLLLRQL